MKKILAGWEQLIDYCDFCEVLIGDEVLHNGSIICHPCCLEKNIPLKYFDVYPFRR
jgi:hypothetical protein